MRGRRFFTLPAPDRVVIAQAVVLLPVTTMLLRMIGFRRTQAILKRWAACDVATPPDALAIAERYGDLVNAASNRGLLRANCLKRSLVTWLLLRRRGIKTELHIGVRRGAHGFEAHAWIEYAGVVVNDHPRYVALFAPFEGDVLAAFTFSK